MKRKLAMLIGLTIAAVSIAGCGSKEEEAGTPVQEQAKEESTGQRPYEGTKLRVILANHNWTDAVTPLLPEFEEATGIEVEVENYAEDQLSEKLAIELTSGSNSLDVMMTRPLQEIQQFVKNGWVYSVNDILEDPEYDAEDLIPSALDSYRSGEECYGIPLVTERQILYYRTDLLEEAGVAVPTNMEELMAAAEVLTDQEKGQYGIVSRGLTAAAVTQFSGYLYGKGGDWMDAEGNAALNTPEAIEAFTYYGDMLRNFGPPGVLNMHWQQAAAIYSQGKVAMFTDADSLFGSACGPDTAVADKTGFAVMPTGKAYNICAWGLSINANSQNTEAAKEFVKWATSKDICTRTQQVGNSGARTSVWEDESANTTYPKELIDVILASEEIGVAYDRPPIISVGAARDVIGEVIVTSISGGDVEEAAEVANEKFQEIIDEDFGK